MDKHLVYNTAQGIVNERINILLNELKASKDGLRSESRSTAGDKHNTSRARMHLEEEKISNQVVSLKKYKEVLAQINPKSVHSNVNLGSLIETNKGYFFLAIPLGWLELKEGNKVMCLSLASPIGQVLKDKSVGDQVVFNQQKWEILSIV